MNDPLTAPDALESMLLSVLSGEASDQDIVLLRKSLIDSESLRERGSEFLYDDVLLTEHCKTDKQHRYLSQIQEIASGTSPGKTTSPTTLSHFRHVATFINTHGLPVAAVAMCLLLSLVGYVNLLHSKIDRFHSLGFVDDSLSQDSNDLLRFRDSGAGPTGTQSQVLGRVAGLDKAVWTNNAAKLEFGDKIELGKKLELESGIVELLLSSGAKVTIEGPAVFEATSTMEANLEIGRITAAAPRVARGYTVLTPTAELVDIGTQFGVLVDEEGDSELHVFDGDVVARSRGDDASDKLIHASEDEAMRFKSSSPTPERFTARRDQFTRHLQSRRSSSELPAIPLTEELSVWYSADMCKKLSVGDRVNVWRDLLTGANDFADDAWQFDEDRSPILVEDEAGRLALRFDGWSTYLETSPIQPQSQQTICIVCLPAPNSYANDLQGQILLKYGDVPSLEISVSKDRHARCWVWPGSNPSVAEVNSRNLAADKPTVLVHEYNYDENLSRLWVNGTLEGSSDAPIAVLQPGSKYIGSHNDQNLRAKFFGGIYEIAIYDKCFEPEELEELTGYFTERYGLE